MHKTTYHYHDEHGNRLYSKIREMSDTDPRHKKFYWQSYKDGNVIYNSSGSRRVLYKLPEVLNAIQSSTPIYLVEGEKDCEKLCESDLVATTAPVTKQWEESFTKSLANADVILLYDNDKAGIQRKELICEKLYGNVQQLRVIDLLVEYRESHGLDITDWLAMGNTIESLKSLVEQAADYKPKKPEHGLHLISAHDILTLELPQREMIMSPFFPSQGLVLLVAKRGVGKTFVALGIAHAVSTGESFLEWHAPQPKRVLYVDGEMPASLMQERFKMITTMTNKQPQPDHLQIITPDLQTTTMRNLSKKEGRALIQGLMRDYDLLVLDNLSCLFRSGSENEAESWQEAQEFALNLRRQGKSILFVHHAGKSGTQRGTSKREDILDTVIILKRPDDYKAEEGARFEVHFDKTRHFAGNDARSFQAQLLNDVNGYRWDISEGQKEELVEKVSNLKRSGYTINQITEETGLTKSQVETKIQKGREAGLI